MQQPSFLTASVFFLAFFLTENDGANILGVFTSTSPSHIIIHMATVKALTEKGHNVTVVTVLPLREPRPKYHHIYVPPSKGDIAELKKKLSNAASGVGVFGSIKNLFSSKIQSVIMQDKALRHPDFQELLKNKANHFDVVILGWSVNTFQLGIAAHFKCPVIVSVINYPPAHLLSAIGNSVDPASTPIVLVNSIELLSFKLRLFNMLAYASLTSMDWIIDYKMAQYYEEHFSGGVSYDEAKRNVSLIFSTNHFSDGVIRPMVPGFVEIGGIQIKERPNPLPRDIHKFLQTANDGFILFSLGTNVKTTDLSHNTTEAIFNVLSELKYKVLWKWDGTKPPGRSPNIMFKKWLPQDDLLTHPKLLLFITHAGKGSVDEAQYHGVPMIAIPMYGDQFGIAQKIEKQGFGLVVDHQKLTEQNFRKQLLEVLVNTKYLEAVLKISMVCRDRPISPKQTVVFWTEYVIRHTGARHIQSPAAFMNFLQKNSLDVLGLLIVVLVLTYLLVRRLFKLFLKMLFKRKTKTD